MPVSTAGTELFTAGDLSHWLQCPVAAETALTVEQVVWGWVKPILGLTSRPDPTPDELFSQALELGGIAHENPAGLAAYQLGEERSQFSAERRAEILRDMASGNLPAGGTPSPRGSFPSARCYPDAVERW